MGDDDEDMPIWERKQLFNDMARHHLPKGAGMPLNLKKDTVFLKSEK